jgi:hypothetical protein
MDDQTAIDVYERDKYSEDHREDRDGDRDAPKGSPIEHDASLTDRIDVDRRVMGAVARRPRRVIEPGTQFAHLTVKHAAAKSLGLWRPGPFPDSTTARYRHRINGQARRLSEEFGVSAFSHRADAGNGHARELADVDGHGHLDQPPGASARATWRP